MKKPISTRAKRIFTAIIAFIIVFVMVMGLITPFIYGDVVYEDSSTTTDEYDQGYFSTLSKPEMPPITTENDNFTMSYTIGFDGKYTSYFKTPVDISIKNTGEPFSGELQIKIDISDDLYSKSYIVYAQDVSINTDETLHVQADIPFDSEKKYHKVVLLDEQGREVYSENISGQMIADDTYTVGVLSDNPSSLGYLSEMKFATPDNENASSPIGESLIFMDKTNFPDNIEILYSFESIIINDFDTKTLSSEQLNALELWVESGGVLILGTGESYEKVMGGINPNIIDASLKGTLTTTDVTNLGLENVKDESSTINNIEINGPKTNIYTNDGRVFTSISPHGDGAVITHTFDLGAEPFINMKGNIDFLTKIYTNEFNIHSISKTYDKGSAESDNLPSLNPFATIIIFIIIFVYILVIGPVLYFVLKRRKALEKGFFIIPIISLVTISIMSLLSINSLYRKPISNTVNCVTLAYDDNATTIASTTSVFSPSKGNLVVETDNIDASVDIYGFSNASPQYNLKTGIIEEDISKMKIGDTREITAYNTSLWEENTFTQTQTLESSESIDCSLSIQDNRLKGTITNNTGHDLENVIVTNSHTFRYYGGLKNGETIDIDQAILAKKHTDLSEYIDTALYENPLEGLSIEEKRQVEFKADLLKYKSFDAHYYSSDYEKNFDEYTSGSEVYGINGPVYDMPLGHYPPQVCVYAFNDDDIMQNHVTVNGEEATQINTNLFFKNEILDFSTMAQYDLPYGYLEVSRITSDVNYENDPDLKHIYAPEGSTVNFVFDVSMLDNMSSLQILWRSFDDNDYQQIYNTKTRLWEVLSSNAYTTPYDYIDENGNITLRAICGESGTLSYPQINVKGGE